MKPKRALRTHDRRAIRASQKSKRIPRERATRTNGPDPFDAETMERAQFGRRIEWMTETLGLPARQGHDGIEVLKNDRWIPLAMID